MRAILGKVARLVRAVAPPTGGAQAVHSSGVRDVLRQMQDFDQVRQPQIEFLDRFFNASGRNQADAAHILNFFTLWPEKCKLIGGSEYFLSSNPASIPLKLAVLAGNYANGKFEQLVPVCDQLLQHYECDLSYALKARIAGRQFGPDAELRAIEAGLERFPESVLLSLYEVETAASHNEVERANVLVERMRSKLERDLDEEIRVACKNQRDLEQAMSERRMFLPSDKDIYSDEMVRVMWQSYYESFNTRTIYQHGDAVVAQSYLDTLERCAGEVDILLDFGSMCAHPIYQSALRYPKTEFFCFDRQQLIADLNSSAYRLPNLHFWAGDIFDALKEVAKLPGRKALLHIRTVCVLYPSFVEKLYEESRRSGIERIIGIENAGMSRTDLRFRDFETMQERAIVTKHRLYLHNYKRLLEDAGYRVEHWRRLPTLQLWMGWDPAAYLGSQYIFVGKAH